MPGSCAPTASSSKPWGPDGASFATLRLLVTEVRTKIASLWPRRDLVRNVRGAGYLLDVSGGGSLDEAEYRRMIAAAPVYPHLDPDNVAGDLARATAVGVQPVRLGSPSRASRALTLPIRALPITDGELVTVGGYPNGRWHLTSGPVTSHDSADFVAHVLLGPGISGAPAVDGYDDLAGLITMDHDSAGAIVVGPQLLDTFVHRTSALLAHLPT
ncbi:MAG: hypothetical protein ACR2GE_01925 [Pseudonocardia sp.]